MKQPAGKVKLSNTLLLLAVMSLGALAPIANAQNITAQGLDQRIQRLERILDNSVLINLVQRFDALQDEVRQLRGELEQKDFQIESMRELQRKLYADMDQRLQSLEQGGGGLSNLDDLSLEELEAELAGQTGAITGQGSTSGARTSSLEASRTSASVENSRQEKLKYQDAYDLLILGRNAQAIASFETFLGEYPDGSYTDNAHYWLGEANYVERRFETAIDSFDVVIYQFPGSRKVPDARLRKGFALFELQRYPEARSELEIVEEEYTGRSIAALARRRLEQMNSAGL